MGRVYTGNPRLLKQVNTSVILDIVQKYGPVSRTDVAARAKLSLATVSRLVEDLVNKGVLLEVGTAKSTGGRRPVLLEFNAAAQYLIGVEVGIESVIGVLTDLQASIVHSYVVPLDNPRSTEDVIDGIKNCIQKLIEKAESLKRPVLEIGVAFHGVVDSQTGTVLFAPHFPSCENVSIKALISTEFGLPARVENHMRTHAQAQMRFGEAKGLDDFVYIYVGRGVGGAIVSGRKVFAGGLKGAGEIGHMTVEPRGPACSCGNHGCLEAMIGADRVVELVKNNCTEVLRNSHESQEAILEQFIESARHGDAACLELLREIELYLSIVIANMVNVLSIDKFFLSGYLACGGEWFTQAVENGARARAMRPLNAGISVVPVVMEPLTGALGAALMVLDRVQSKQRVAVVSR